MTYRFFNFFFCSAGWDPAAVETYISLVTTSKLHFAWPDLLDQAWVNKGGRKTPNPNQISPASCAQDVSPSKKKKKKKKKKAKMKLQTSLCILISFASQRCSLSNHSRKSLICRNNHSLPVKVWSYGEVENFSLLLSSRNAYLSGCQNVILMTTTNVVNKDRL